MTFPENIWPICISSAGNHQYLKLLNVRFVQYVKLIKAEKQGQ